MRLSFCLLFCLVLFSCENQYENQLLGKWQAYELLEEGKRLEVQPEVINFNFMENGLYTYQGTLTYKEAGNYYLKSDLLYTVDTVNEGSVEKAVRIMSLNPDSLLIKMNDRGKERVMKLKPM